MEFVSQWLLAVPIWFSAVLLTTSGAIFAAAGIWVVNSIWTPQELAVNNNVGGFKYAFLGQVVSALLGFVLLEAGTTYVGAQQHVRTEVTALQQAALTLNELPPAIANPLRAAEQHYIISVVEDEWPALAKGGESQRTARALKDLYSALLATSPSDERDRSLVQQIFGQLDRVVDMRTARVGDAAEELSGLIWFSICVAVGVSLIYLWFFGSDRLMPQIMMGALLAVAVMTLVELAIVLGHPFVGELAISNKGYWEVLRDLETDISAQPLRVPVDGDH